MKKYYWLSIFLVMIGIFSFLIYPKAETNYKNGDIRCPSGHSGKCFVSEDGNKAVVTEQLGDFKVVKTVSKTNNLGEYEVSFQVEGSTTTTMKKAKDAYVVVIFDKSSSIKENILKESKEAAIEFSKALGNINLSLILFAGSTSKSNFSTTPFTDSMFSKNVGQSSHIEQAIKDAYDLLNKKSEKSNKYVILFGDGQYWFSDNTCNAKNKDTAECKKNGIYYEGELEKLQKIKNLYTYAILYDAKNGSGTDCNENYISKFVKNCSYTSPEWSSDGKTLIKAGTIKGEDCFDARNADKNGKYNYSTFFNKIKDKIINKQENTADTISLSLVDTAGSNFTIINSDKKTVEYSITNTNAKLDSFSIKINTSTNDIWNETNSGFSLTYNNKTYTSKINPEVYWVKGKEWEGCSDYASDSFNKTINPNQYIELSCSQNEWVDGSGTIKPGYYAGLTLGSIGITTPPNHSFYVKKGGGFAGNIELESKLVCQISINTASFITDYARLNQLIANETDERQRAELLVHRNNMDNFIISDISNTNIKELPNEMLKFREKFINQGAELTVNYKNRNLSSEKTTFILSGDITDEEACIGSNEVKININGIDYLVYGNKTCELHLKKKLTLPTRCLMMKTGEAVDCMMESNEQIQGSNVFYVPLDEKEGGYVSVSLPNATYSGRDINLDGNNKNDEGSYKCEYNIINGDKPIFRQIELKDPFLKTYNKDRKVGKNWNNTDNGLSFNFNFENIIKDDIWSNNYLFRYTMSKVDVANINKNTRELGPDSYLGNTCYINSDNKYVCDFIRPQAGSDGNNLFFTKIEEGKNN